MTDTQELEEIEEIIEAADGTEETAIVATEPKEQEEPKETKEPKSSWILGLLRKYRRHLLGAAAGVLAACMFMWLGFWKTLFILGMAGLGAYLCGADNKMDTLKRLINRIIPGRK